MKSLTAFLLVLSLGNAQAQIDSGGGKAQIGTFTNHASLGGIVYHGMTKIAPTTHRSGLIEVLYSAGAPKNPDANANGLPDDWEQQHFSSQIADPLADSDGDGANNRMEYIVGTDPSSRASVFKPGGSFASGLYTLPIPTLIGRTYKVYATRDLTNWHLQQTFTGNGTTQTFTFDEKTMPSGPLHASTHPSTFFFRIEVTLP